MNTKIITVALSLIAANFSAQAVGLVNGDFEAPSLGGAPGAYYPFYDPIPAGFGWTVAVNKAIDHVGSFWQPSSGQQSIDLSGFDPGAMYQDFTFPSGGTWTVKFDMSVNPAAGGNRSVGVEFGLAGGSLSSLGMFTLNSAGRTLANMNWVGQTTASFTVNASSTYRLQFVALDGDASGAALDNITLVQVPEPGSVSLVLAGVVIVSARRGIKNRKA